MSYLKQYSIILAKDIIKLNDILVVIFLLEYLPF